MHALISLLFLTILLRPARSVYFYIEGTTPKCFYEELRKDTLVVGHYSAEEYSPQTNSYVKSDALGIFIFVDEVFENEHRIVSSKGSSTGKFTFTAADSGDHKLCFTPSHSTGHSGWLHSGQSLGGVKLTLDLAIGETSAIESADKDKIQDIVQKFKDLNMRLQDIKREQIFQREREAEFRDQSESTNARVVRWTLIQLVVLAITCAWQLSHLRSFFIKQKLT